MDHFRAVQNLDCDHRVGHLETENAIAKGERMTHTPGPWSILPITSKYGFTSDVRTVVAGNFQVCDCVGLTPNADEEGGDEYASAEVNLANARAIAALPELIKACELLIAQYDAVSDFKIGGALTNEPFLKIKAILNQATGGNLRKPVSAG